MESSHAAFACSRILEIRSRKCQMSHNFSLFSKLPTGVAAGVARLLLGWQLPPHATPVDPPLHVSRSLSMACRHSVLSIINIEKSYIENYIILNYTVS